MKTIRDFINLVEADEIDPSQVVKDKADGGEQEYIVIDGVKKKVLPIPPDKVARIREVFKRVDAILKKYPDPDNPGQTFESVDFESMTEGEQRQYIMQNLHLLSEADQMVVLRAITNESTAGEIIGGLAKGAKYGIEKGLIPAVKWVADKGEKAVGWAAKMGEKAVGGIWNSVVDRLGVPLALWASKAGLIIYVGGQLGLWVIENWRDIFQMNPKVMENLDPEDWKEMTRLYDEFYNQLVPEPPADSVWGWPPDLGKEADSIATRWSRFNVVGSRVKKDKNPAGPTEKEKSLGDLAIDKLKGLLK